MTDNDNTYQVPAKPEYTPEERAALAGTKRGHFAAVSKECATEFDSFAPCAKCGFLDGDCHRTCGIIMKHERKTDGVVRGNAV